jgi:hypothetical protein
LQKNGMAVTGQRYGCKYGFTAGDQGWGG